MNIRVTAPTYGCDFCSFPTVPVTQIFPGRDVTITASSGLSVDVFPVGKVSGDWQACSYCAPFVTGDKDQCAIEISDRIVQAAGYPNSAVHPRVIALLSRYWACVDEARRRRYVIDELCSPSQRTLIDLYRNTRPSNHPGGHYLERRSSDGVHVSAFLRTSSSSGRAVLYFYDIFSEQRGKGRASAMLRRLVESADRHGATVELPVMANDVPGMLGGLGHDDLVNWYGRFGFMSTVERSPAGHPLMRRPPAIDYRRQPS